MAIIRFPKLVSTRLDLIMEKPLASRSDIERTP
jgi:hypothetical protein